MEAIRETMAIAMNADVPAHGLSLLAVTARREEREVAAQFGTSYRRYADRVPAFVPRLFPTIEDVA